MILLLCKLAASYGFFSIIVLGLTYGSYLELSTSFFFILLPVYILQIVWDL